MVERVQKTPVLSATRWLAGVASAYCFVLGPALFGTPPSYADPIWIVGAAFGLLTLLPQLCRRRRAFRVMCFVTVAVISIAAFFTVFFGGFLFLPATLPLLLAAVVPAPSVRVVRGHTLRVRLTAAVALIALLMALAAVGA
jgi:hypothetical protein